MRCSALIVLAVVVWSCVVSCVQCVKVTVGCGCVELRCELGAVCEGYCWLWLCGAALWDVCTVWRLLLAVVVWSCVVSCVQCVKVAAGCGCVELCCELCALCEGYCWLWFCGAALWAVCSVWRLLLAVVVWSCVVSCVHCVKVAAGCGSVELCCELCELCEGYCWLW